MTPERALQINETLVTAWMIRERIQTGAVPDVSGFSPQDAVLASEMMRDQRLGERRNSDGTMTFACYIESTRVRSLYAWTLAASADGERHE